MHTARRTFVATGTVALLAAAGVTAAIAADPAPPPPPNIAFLANGIVPADALAAGPIAGQLGAPIYTTQPDALSPAAATGLDDHDPELVIVLGGPVAITDGVIDQVEAATGLAESAEATPDGGIVRAAGGDRFDTAAAVADLLADYNPAYLPINMQAIDADTLDGKQATEFALKSDLGTGGSDADTLDGKHADDFQPAGNYLAADGKANTAGHADTAGDADTLDGNEASDFASADDAVSALGYVNSTGTLVDSSGVDSVSYNVALRRYEIEFSNFGFILSHDIAMVTPTGSGATMTSLDSVGGKLLVYLYDEEGNAVEDGFQFLVHNQAL